MELHHESLFIVLQVKHEAMNEEMNREMKPAMNTPSLTSTQ